VKSTRRNAEKSKAAWPRAEDCGAVWFLELDLAEQAGDYDAAQAARDELQRLGWDVRRRPQLAEGTTS